MSQQNGGTHSPEGSAHEDGSSTQDGSAHSSNVLHEALLRVPTYEPGSDEPEVRVDEKTAFSAERTFVQWFHLACTVGFVAFGATSISTSMSMHFTARLLAFPAAFFAVWPVFTHRRRLKALADRSPNGLEDRTGPLVAVCVMVVVVLLSTANAWRQFNEGSETRSEREYDEP